MPTALRRRAAAIGTCVLLALPLAATAVPAEAETTTASKAEARSRAEAQARRSFAMTWQANNAPSRDRAIYHCARGNQIVGAAHIVEPADAVRFSCSYDKSTDWPYGVLVYQPAGRRVIIKVGTKVVQDYAPQSEGRDVWVVQGNPTGWWRTVIR